MVYCSILLFAGLGFCDLLRFLILKWLLVFAALVIVFRLVVSVSLERWCFDVRSFVGRLSGLGVVFYCFLTCLRLYVLGVLVFYSICLYFVFWFGLRS